MKNLGALCSVGVAVDLLDPLPTNTNKMTDEDFARLVSNIKEFGFLQPILVTEGEAGRHTIVDGVHRHRAAVAAGMEIVPVINVTGFSPAQVRALQMSMNRLRGEPNLAEVARQMAAIQEEVDLLTTGYSEHEISRLLNATKVSMEDEERAITEAALSAKGEEKEAKLTEGVVLEVELADARTMRDVKKAAKKMGNGDVGLGIMRALGLADEG